MKKYKNLIIYYLIIIGLSLVSIFSYNAKGNDILTATASLTADITLILSVITVTYAVLFCCNYLKEALIKKEKKFDLKMIKTLIILLITLIIIFISFINVFSHKTIFEFLHSVIVNNENKDIITLFFKSLLAYYFIYLCAVNGLISNNLFLDEDNDYVFPILLIAFTVICSLILLKVGLRLLYFVLIIDIVLYFVARLLWGEYEKRNKNKKKK